MTFRYIELSDILNDTIKKTFNQLVENLNFLPSIGKLNVEKRDFSALVHG